MARRGPDQPGAGAPLEGRLDLDSLDDDHVRLDVIGDDRPGLVERWRGSGAAEAVARHRTAVVAAVVVVSVALAAGGLWWVRRPPPLGDARVTARADAQGPAVSLVTDPVTGSSTDVTVRLALDTQEPSGVSARLLGITGPGLSTAPTGDGLALEPSSSGQTVVVASALACAAPEATTAALSSSAADYAVLVRRTSAAGESRVDRLPFDSAQDLARVVHQACLQIAADRDLLVTRLDAAPVPGVVAVRLDVALFNPSRRVWSGVHVAASAQPVVTNDGTSVELQPGASGDLRAMLWPADCSDPAAALRRGLAIETDLGPDGLPPSSSTTADAVTLRVTEAMVRSVAAALAPVCGAVEPRGSVTWARLREGGGSGSGGVIDLGLTLTTPGAGLVEVDHLGDGGPTTGELFAYETPVHAVDGVATIKAQWRLPTCETIVASGLPRLQVVLAGDVRRPYLVPLRGDALRPVLFRLCGQEVADLAG